MKKKNDMSMKMDDSERRQIDTSGLSNALSGNLKGDVVGGSAYTGPSRERFKQTVTQVSDAIKKGTLEDKIRERIGDAIKDIIGGKMPVGVRNVVGALTRRPK